MEEAPHGMEIVTRYFADFTPEQLEQLAALEALYGHWNTQINVISRKDIGSLYEKHVLHSLSIAAVFDFPPGSRVIDIGTGGGFPGIPLAIFFPEVDFHLVDSIGKKLKVVEGIKEALGLKNVSTEHIRAEEIKGRKFDVAVSRAAASLRELWEWSRPLLKNQMPQQTRDSENGRPFASGLICLKGGDLNSEISDSGSRPGITDVHQLFPEPAFIEKYLLHIPYGRG
ncbi:MAG: 16S rRNA (guanine(527)-N(7))-methyltransferase RsmG [Bacteroidota bacterium]|nr:16S rRNA (guanine(527)-N(7))-methyltransferase RsmG [Bacteroidota bacterium]